MLVTKLSLKINNKWTVQFLVTTLYLFLQRVLISCRHWYSYPAEIHISIDQNKKIKTCTFNVLVTMETILFVKYHPRIVIEETIYYNNISVLIITIFFKCGMVTQKFGVNILKSSCLVAMAANLYINPLSLAIISLCGFPGHPFGLSFSIVSYFLLLPGWHFFFFSSPSSLTPTYVNPLKSPRFFCMLLFHVTHF